jgi:two-component system OmpR family response regulator
MPEPKILVVEDEPSVRDLICDALSLAGYLSTPASDGFEATQLLRAENFDLIVTDVNMPRVDGYELVERIRERGNQTPVIFLTARNEKPDIARGLRLGADDYVTKPFGLEELTLRVAAILRRTKKISEGPEILTCGPVSANLSSYAVQVGGQEVSLSPTEFRLLTYLMENKNKVLTKNALLDEIWGLGFVDSSSVVDTFISYLRKKVHINGFEGVRTVRGVGFQIADK